MINKLSDKIRLRASKIRSCYRSEGPRTRRSSIVVIPPMQICPGDLLVYSKVLTQRNNLMGELTRKTRSPSHVFTGRRRRLFCSKFIRPVSRVYIILFTFCPSQRPFSQTSHPHAHTLYVFIEFVYIM